jgi:hypothetical protein
MQRAAGIGGGDEVDSEGIMRAREETHASSTSPRKTPPIAGFLAHDGNFIACFHIEFPEFSIARECEQYSRPTSVNALLEIVVLFFVI